MGQMKTASIPAGSQTFGVGISEKELERRLVRALEPRDALHDGDATP